MMTEAQKRTWPVAAGHVAKQVTENASIVTLRGDDDKQFFTLRAQFALLGHALHRIDSKDGPAAFFAEHCGTVCYLSSVDDAEAWLAAVSGARP